MTTTVSASPELRAATAVPVIHVNDRVRPLPESGTVLALVLELGLGERKGVAVAVNGNVVPRGRWPDQALAADDRVLVIQATQGG
ncbi:MAG: thiamine biosynthesis protein ThiS [Verrucomicrobia bacterium]|nr:thiamine biosynthesis protein ThiS [Verrucomicrobiota bacterium]